jgi:zinc D-Ala-D-Ala carboxypeptidase
VGGAIPAAVGAGEEPLTARRTHGFLEAVMRTMICPRCWGALHDAGGAPCDYCGGHGVTADEAVSPHFMLSELLVSEAAARLGIPNDPPPAVVAALRELAQDLLEPVRSRFGAIRITSGYRSPALNAAIGGSPTSVHQLGHAADLNPAVKGITRKQVIEFVLSGEAPFDQVIHEGTWCHVARRSPARTMRREALMMFGGKYAPYDAGDPRVAT